MPVREGVGDRKAYYVAPEFVKRGRLSRFFRWLMRRS
jgi:hypothetical protein